MENIIHIAVLGLGGRGTSLIRDTILPAAAQLHIEIAAVYDPYTDRRKDAADLIEKISGKRPAEAASSREIMENPQIQAVLISSAWESHVDLAIAAMKAGKYAAFEVGGAYCLEDCWNLVRTFEETGTHCMMLENCCYGQKELAVLNMVRQGMLGEVVHCEGGYHHDLRDEISGGKENRHYRLRNYLNRNCENYPTHELGPIAKLLDINNGNRMVSLTSTASCAKGLHSYIIEHSGPDSALASAVFQQGDIVTTVIRCAGGQTITLTLDTTLPRAYSRGFTVRGTSGSYFEDNNSFFLDHVHNDWHFQGEKLWGNGKEYMKKYPHPLWKDYDPEGGHGGMDGLVFSAFIEAVRKQVKPPIDVYDAAAYMCITALSEQSIAAGSMPVAIPDFTRGKWYMRDDIDFDLTYNLDRKDVSAGLY